MTDAPYATVRRCLIHGRASVLAVAGKQPRDALLAASNAMFFLKRVDAQTAFSRDDRGAFTILTLHEGGWTTKGTKP